MKNLAMTLASRRVLKVSSVHKETEDKWPAKNTTMLSR